MIFFIAIIWMLSSSYCIYKDFHWISHQNIGLQTDFDPDPDFVGRSVCPFTPRSCVFQRWHMKKSVK